MIRYKVWSLTCVETEVCSTLSESAIIDVEVEIVEEVMSSSIFVLEVAE